MRFKSKAQARYMFATHPRIAKRVADGMKTKRNKHPLRSLPNKIKRRKTRAAGGRRRKK